MSLATRCTQCGTVFRVAQDQLKVSEGWVRCGRCDEVFSALEGLFDLERESPPPLPASSAEDIVSHRDQAYAGSHREPEHVARPRLPTPLGRSTRSGAFDQDLGRPAQEEDEDTVVRLSSSTARSRPSAAESDEAEVEGEDETLEESLAPGQSTHDGGPETVIGGSLADVDFADARHSSELLLDPDAAGRPFEPGTAEAEALAIAEQARPAPGFVRKADSRARWQSPLARTGLTVLALLLALGLLLQYVHHDRDLIAARWPAAEPALQAWCGIAGCTIQAPRQLADVRIESSKMTPAPSAAGVADGAVRLSVVLRNHGAIRVLLPSLDVTLTDNAGRTVSRRALSPADFGVTDPVLPSGAESTLQAVLDTGERKAAGYTVDVFYP